MGRFWAYALLLVLFFAAARPVAAVGMDYYGIESVILEDNTIQSKITMIFDGRISSLEYPLKGEVRNFRVESGTDMSDCMIDTGGSRMLCTFVPKGPGNQTQIVLNMTETGQLTQKGDEYEFRTNYPISYNVKRLFRTVYLPETSSLRSGTNESYSPKYGKTLSDGRHIIIMWEKENVAEGDDLYFSVSYKMPMPPSYAYNLFIMAIIAIVIIAALGMFYFKTTRKVSIQTIIPVLKGDEKRIVDILMANNGSAKQKLLVRETDFSKAKVSRIMSSLKERGVVDIEHMGRTNKVTLKFKK
jgi:hypothetical protein